MASVRTTLVSDTWSPNDWDHWRAIGCPACKLVAKYRGLTARCSMHKPPEYGKPTPSSTNNTEAVEQMLDAEQAEASKMFASIASQNTELKPF